MVEIERVLAPVDFSEASLRGLRYAQALAERFDAKIDVLHVVGPPVLPDWGFAKLAVHESEARKRATIRLPKLIESAQVDPNRVGEFAVRSGAAAQAIEEFAESVGSSVVTLASHGSGGWPFGGTVERVLRLAKRSVLTFRPDDKSRTMDASVDFAPKRILAPTDFSDASAAAFPVALSIAKRFEAQLSVIYVAPNAVDIHTGDSEEVNSSLEWVEAEARRRLPEFRSSLLSAHLSVETAVVRGKPAVEILDYAQGRDYDLIVMSSSGLSGATGMHLGSVTEKVSRQSTCPTWIVKS